MYYFMVIFAGNSLRLYKTHSDAVRSMYLCLRPVNVGHGTGYII